ncbi:hypothetical protein AX769_01630 [Frondihabitans sp. PAMC 28766]|uniref:amidase domain-containing protein n=1 Tax=Frondihabitans sp. PAMC 28766 TaxID=1795630 RepID=UPI00078DC481|nr:amidase domain-containing protein [Frondihabitans sp. PAMC 28766]AMM19073.1 hypothetical protein AX769_01630 [Frondihabitans sp. PAMC 28766]
MRLGNNGRILGAAAAAIVASALLAGCTTGAGGTSGATPGASSAAGSAGATAPAAASTVARVTSASSSAGSLVGGETVTLSGSNLTGVDKVTFNGVASPAVVAKSPTSVTAVVPSAVNYQPSSGAIAVYKGAAIVASARSLTYTWAAKTGVDREMQYAFAHWNLPRYNAAYANFDSLGGDCQNFVSQSLLAAGLAKSTSWFYDSEASHSTSWAYAPSFNDLAPSLGFTRLASTQRSQLQVGDLAYFDWNNNGVPDHVMIVSAVSTVAGTTTVKLVGHNLDYDYRDLDTTLTKDHPGGTVWFYSLPTSLRS